MPSFLVTENFTRPEVLGLWGAHLFQASVFAAAAVTIGYGAAGRIQGAKAPVLTVIWFLTGLGILFPLLAAPFLCHVVRAPVVLGMVAPRSSPKRFRVWQEARFVEFTRLASLPIGSISKWPGSQLSETISARSACAIL